MLLPHRIWNLIVDRLGVHRCWWRVTARPAMIGKLVLPANYTSKAQLSVQQ